MISISISRIKIIITIITIHTHLACRSYLIPHDNDGSCKISIENKPNLFYPNFCFMTKIDLPLKSDFYSLLLCASFDVFLESVDDQKEKFPYLKVNKIYIAKIIKTGSTFDPEVLKDSKIKYPYRNENELQNDHLQFLVYQNFKEDSYAEKQHKIFFSDSHELSEGVRKYLRYTNISNHINFLIFTFAFKFKNEFILKEGYELHHLDINDGDSEDTKKEMIDSKELYFEIELSYFDTDGVPVEMKIFDFFSQEMTNTLVSKFEAFKILVEDNGNNEIDLDTYRNQLFRLPTENEKEDFITDLGKLFERRDCAESLFNIDFVKLPQKDSQIESESEDEGFTVSDLDEGLNDEDNKDDEIKINGSGESKNEKVSGINKGNKKDKNSSKDSDSVNEKNSDNHENDEKRSGDENKNEENSSSGKKIFLGAFIFLIFLIVVGSFYYLYSKKTVIKL